MPLSARRTGCPRRWCRSIAPRSSTRSSPLEGEKEQELATLHLPPAFETTIRNVFGERGERYLAELPALVDAAVERWGLSHVRMAPELSYNFVAFANRGAENVVLKVGVPHDELISEIAALRFYAGNGAARLLEADAPKGTFLVERLQPGRMLAALEDDEGATRIAGELMFKLWKRAPERGQFLLLWDWFDGFKRLRERFEGGTGPLPLEWVERAEGIAKAFSAEQRAPVLLHGDFHHYNILQAGEEWKAIDPKGVIGPAGYEVGPLMLNPWGRVLADRAEERSARRIDILAEILGMEKKRVRDWAIAHAILSAWWSVESNEDWRYAIRCAELFGQIKLTSD